MTPGTPESALPLVTASLAPESELPANSDQFADSCAPGAAAVAPADSLEADMVQALVALGLVSLRAEVVNPRTLAPSRRWALHELAPSSDAGRETRSDAAFPGAAVLVERLGLQPGQDTLAHRVSPRRWVLAWRLDGGHVALAVVHFAESRAALPLSDTGLVRLVCDAGLRGSPVLSTALPPAAPSWPVVERRGRLVPRWITWPSLLLVALAAALAGWLAWVAVPAHREAMDLQQAELERLHTMADSTVRRSVTAALAAGDYGEVQSALDGFAALGYFEQAVVTNPRGLTVAWVGATLGARIGEAPPESLRQRATGVALMQGQVPIGRLLIARSPAVMSQLPGVASLQWQAGLVMAIACLAVVLMATRWPQRQRKRQRARAGPQEPR